MASFFTSPLKTTLSILPIYCQFESQLADGEHITDVITDMSVSSGIDPLPSAMLDGSPSIAQDIALQVVAGGVAGVMYLLSFNVTTNFSNRLVMSTYIAVINENPYQPV